MNTSKEIRLFNAKEIARELGSAAALAKKMNKSDSLINQYIGTNPVRGIGNKIAREIEAAAQKPTGWLDKEHQLSDQNLEFLEGEIIKVPVLENKQVEEWVKGELEKSLVSEWKPYLIQKGSDKVFYIKVTTDHMTSLIGSYPSFRLNEMLAVDPENKELVNGGCYIAKIDNQVAFRRLIFKNSKPLLVYINSHYDDESDDFEILGRVIGVSYSLLG